VLTKKETHYLNPQAHGARIIEQAGGRCARLLSDFYHLQMEEQDIGDTMTRFKAIKKAGYCSWLIVESNASDDPDAALERALKYVRRQWQEA
jgi:sugar phosphate isomerase/epimerase